MEKNAFKESLAKEEFNKVFGFLKDIDIFDEFTKVRLKISTMTSNQRSKLLAYVTIRSAEDPQFKSKLDDLNNLIDQKIKENSNGKVVD